ncbi:hypothetical protein [Primorskyibacter marinus]|uniref:hypothetical protein n=1 Tax=Primorskyibacter marinus TaxID=1977320 RepID=UPI000E30876A|nr:hypothetical protein [Primorskyibacter marinus]
MPTPQTLNIAFMSPRLRGALDLFLSGAGQGFNAYIEKRAHMADLARLDAKSDEELSRMGLRRDDIPRYVFRDLIGA